MRCLASARASSPASAARTSSTRDSPTVYSDTTTSISRCRASSLAASDSASRSCSRKTSTPRSRILGHELVVLVLRPLDPEHVVEEQVVMVRRRQPLEAELRAVDHHLAERAYLGVDTERWHGCCSRRVWSARRPGCRPWPSTICSISAGADRGSLAGGLDEADGGVDLRTHRAGANCVATQLGGRDLVEPALLGRAPVRRRPHRRPWPSRTGRHRRREPAARWRGPCR